MTLDLNDARLAQLLTDMVDRRVRAALDAQARIRYGTVSAVDTTAGTASVLLGASATPSPGFVYPGWAPPRVGDRVRVVNRGADRYIEDNLTDGLQSYRGLGVQRTTTTAVSNTTWTNVTAYNTGRTFGQNESKYAQLLVDNYRVQLNVSGLWLLYSHVTWTQGTGHRLQGFSLGGVTSPASTLQIRSYASNIQSDIYAYSVPIWLPAGQLVTLQVWQNSGATRDMSNATFGVILLGSSQPGDV